MRKKLLALILALLMAISCLTGCASKEAKAFYSMAEEMVAQQDVYLELVAPYHGANLLVNGYICRSSQTADLVFTLEGTGSSDGVWTELRISGNQLWLNVKQLAERTLAFDLPSLQRGDIQDLEQDQTADWVCYTWQGDLWSGVPDWSSLLHKVWENCKPNLNSHISGTENSYTLELSGSSLEKAQRNLLQDLVDKTEDFRKGFCTWTETETDLVAAVQMGAEEFFQNYWQTWNDELTALEEGTDQADHLTLTFSKEEDSYELAWTVDDGDGWALTVTPTNPQTPEIPEIAMEFGAYSDATYYLLTFSNSYISDVLEGVEMDPELEQIFQGVEDSVPDLQPMETGKLAGYEDLASIQFVPEGGKARTVPVLASYQANSVASLDGNGGQITDLTLEGQGWYQYIYAQDPEGKQSSVFLEDSIRSFYEAYVNLSGYLLVQDLTDQSVSDQGALAQGFSYREDDYSEPIMQLLILLPREGNEYYTVLDLELHLSQMSQADKDAVTHLFDYLGLELTLDLNA